MALMNTRQLRYYDILNQDATNRGFTLLSSYYENTSTKMTFQCVEGHRFDMTPRNFKAGQGCSKCAGTCPQQARELFYTHVEARQCRLDNSSEYINTATKVNLVCLMNHNFSITPHDFKKGHGCPKCAGNCPKASEDDFYFQINERRCKILNGSVYINNTTKVSLECSDGHIFSIVPLAFKSGHGCSKCAGNCPEEGALDFYTCVTQRQYRLNDNSKYINSRTKISLLCPSNHEFTITPNHFKNGQGCPKCAETCSQQAEEELRLQVKQRFYQFIPTSKYINTHTKIDLQCPLYHILSIRPHDFKTGQGCPKCAGTCPDQARTEFYTQLNQRQFQIVDPSSYFDNSTKIGLLCPQKHKFDMAPKTFKSGQGCHICNESSGEQITRAALNHLRLPFISQYKPIFANGKIYDFVCYQSPQRPVIIEWDGEQHFGIVGRFHHDEEDYNKGREVDIIKTQLALNHRCKVIRIDYTWLMEPLTIIATFIQDAIANSENLSLSTPLMYMWLTSQIWIPPKVKLNIIKR